MSKVFVIDSEKVPLEPCHPAVARRLLRNGEAAVWQRHPFTIILKKSISPELIKTGQYTLSADPGSKTTGLAITDSDDEIVYAAELFHRGQQIKKALVTRAGFRRGRRTRNLRYRPMRWANRSRKVAVLTGGGTWQYMKVKGDKGWVAPSLMSRIFNLATWVFRLRAVAPITALAIEHVRFDMQLMENPAIHGIEYQQGTLHGYEIREYLLIQTGGKCAYCDAEGLRLEVEHIVPKSKGGSSRIGNLTMACRPCNQKKGNLWSDALAAKCGKAFAKRVLSVLDVKGKGLMNLRDAAAVNTIRWKLVETLEATGLPVALGAGGKTAYHRHLAGLPKTHYYDAASVACVPRVPKSLRVDKIYAIGYGRRDNLGYQFAMKAPGFRRPSHKCAHADGFRKLDHVEMTKRNGTKITGVLNCFDKTAPMKPKRCRVLPFDETTPDARRSGNTSELVRIRHRDGYRYGNVPAMAPRHRHHEPPKQPIVPDISMPGNPILLI